MIDLISDHTRISEGKIQSVYMIQLHIMKDCEAFCRVSAELLQCEERKTSVCIAVSEPTPTAGCVGRAKRADLSFSLVKIRIKRA